MRPITEIIVHCSATPEGKDFTVQDIDRWHEARGFCSPSGVHVGYHYIIYRDGSLHQGRPLIEVGAHAGPEHNPQSIGVCYIGGCAADGKTPKDTRTPQQKTTLLDLLTRLRAQFPKAKIFGHYQFAAKACPSFNISEYADL